jgi:hypothetical protein
LTAAGGAAVVAPAGTLTGSTLAAGVTASSLTSVGPLTGGSTAAGFTVNLGTSTISGTLPTANTAALSGDVSKTAGTNPTVVAKVNGVGFAASPSVDTFPVITAANTATYTSVPNCTGALTYSTSTHTVGCNAALGTGSVTSVAVSGGTTGLTTSGGPITTAGTITVAGTLNAASGGTGVASPTAHSIPINQGSSAQTTLGPGTTGQCVVQQTSADPIAAGGCMVLLNTLTASGATSISDTTSMTAAYSRYYIVFDNIVPTPTGAACLMTVHSGGSFQSANYQSGSQSNIAGGAQNVASTGSTLSLNCSRGTAAGGVNTNSNSGLSGTYLISAPADTTHYKMFTGTAMYTDNSGVRPVLDTVWGSWTGGTGAIDGFSVTFTSGTFSGVIRVYGAL